MENKPLANMDNLKTHWPMMALVLFVVYVFWHYNSGPGR